nr:MAG: hypothetical protein [Marnaviridae sp.]
MIITAPLFFAKRAFDAVTQRSERHHPKNETSAFFSRNDEVMLYIEASLTLLYNFRNAKSSTALAVASCTFFSVVTGKSATGSILRMIDQFSLELSQFLPFFQSGPNDWIEICEDLYKNVHRVSRSLLGNKIIKVFNHLIAHTFYAKMGIEIDSDLFSKIEEKKIRPTVWNCMSFADAIVGLLLFVARAGRQALLTGSIDAFFVDSSVVTKWLDKAAALRKESEFIGNLKAVGNSIPNFLKDLVSAIDDGKKLLKVFTKPDEHKIIYSVLLELEMVEKRHTVSLLASSFRWCPIGVFIYGDTSVAKSFISAGLFNHYCTVRGVKDGVMWTNNEKDDFESGYRSHMLGAMFDDMCKFRSSKVQGIDKMIETIISAINNTSWVTNQADLNDKGKVPFLAEWVGVTSNVADLLADQYFNCSAAFLRRFTVRITPIVKEEFRVAGETKIDSSKIPANEQYPDCWTFDVHVPKVEEMKGRFVHLTTCQNYSELLILMTGIYEKHIAVQTKLLETVGKMGPEELCACLLPKSLCRCKRSIEDKIIEKEIASAVFADEEFSEGELNPFSRTVAQAGAVHSPTDRTVERIKAILKLRSEMFVEYSSLVGADLIFFRQLWTEHLIKGTDVNHVDDRPIQDIVYEIRDFVLKSMLDFAVLDPTEKLDLITDDALLEEVSDVYLSFAPRKGEKCFYVKEHLARMKESVINFIGKALTDSEMALLDAYLYEKVPRYIADGWPLSDIIRGGIDYVKFYGKVVEDPERLHVREFLLTDRGETSYIERIGSWCFQKYFEHKFVYNAFNYLSSFTLVRNLALKLVPRKRTMGIRNIASDAGAQYDLRLKGDNKTVKIIIMVCGAATIIGVIIAMFSRFGMKEKEEVEHIENVQPQMDLNSVGKKPAVRGDERNNVWRVPERTITRFDVDPRRPQDIEQCYNAVKRNLCYAECRMTIDGKPHKSVTRVLFAHSQRIIANNHAIVAGSKMTVWFGKKTEKGIQPSVEFDIQESMLTRHPSRDLVFIETWSFPCLFKRINHLFPKRTFQCVGPAFYFMKQQNGTVEIRDCHGLTKRPLGGFVSAESADFDAWTVHPSQPTEHGDCGSVLAVQSPIGAVLLGLHCAYSGERNIAWTTPLFFEDFDDLPMVQIGVLSPAVPLAQVKVIEGEYHLEASDKLFTDFHEDGKMIVHGQLVGFRPRMKATGTKTSVAPFMIANGGELSPPITDRLYRPLMGAWEQPQNVLKNYLHPTHSMREDIWKVCVKAYCRYLEKHLTKEDLADIHPVPLNVAVNGFPGVPNVDAQKFTTSAGHGHTGAKLQFLSEQQAFEEWSHFRAYDDVIVKDVDIMRENAAKGIRPHAVYNSNLKDEMLAMRKIVAGKTRTFYVCPVAFLCNMRMSTLGMCRVMVRRRDIFGTAIGLNCHSEEWNDCFERAERIEGNNCVAGDFEAYESILSILISNGTNHVFKHIAALSNNYDPSETLVLDTLLADTVNPTINFFGTLITLLGGEASGHQMTTHFNSVANNLLHMYAYVVIALEKASYDMPDYFEEDFDVDGTADEFFDKVFRDTLGDDVYLKVSPDRSEYNHTTIKNVFAGMGIKYTMADKTAESVPYIPIEDVSFLKRKFCDHEAFPGIKVAALEKESIYKMMLYTIPSKAVSEEEQLAAAFCSAQAEAFFHGRTFFDEISELIEKAPKTSELRIRMEENPRPSWFKMIKRFIESSPKLMAQQIVPATEMSETSETKRSYCHVNEIELQTSWSVDAWGSTAMERSSEVCFHRGVKQSPKKVHKSRRIKEDPDFENEFLTKNILMNTNTVFGQDAEMTRTEKQTVINKLYQKKLRKDKVKRWFGKSDTRPQPKAQSGMVVDTGVEPAMTTSQDVHQQTITFANEPVGEHLDMGAKATRTTVSMNMPQGISTYFERPRLIRTFEWDENAGNGPKDTFTPWKDFFTSAEMSNKLQGYSLLSCKLHLKFLINGSPFYYGALMANYTPLDGHRTDTARDGSFLGNELVLESQKPHVWLNNQDCSQAEMTLPFLYPYPYVEVTSQALEDMGRVRLIQYVPLLSANGTSSSAVTVQVYAWAEDLYLAGPTNLPVAQSGFRPNKQISGPASAIANAAGALRNVPVIGAYAMATETMAKTVGNIAGFFGFTNTPVITDVQPYKPVPFQLASSEISEPVMKLSLQPKQEIAIGSAQHGGSDKDELALLPFVQRTSFLVGTEWSTTDVPGDPLFTTAVTPQMVQVSNVHRQWAWTPLGYPSSCFQYWRGTIRFTFKIIRSPYHRGRVQISWDRKAQDLALSPPIGNPNTYTVVMDLDETDTVTMDVPYSQAKQFLQVRKFASIPVAPWSTDAVPVGTWGEFNGVLSVRVLNRLTAPEASSNVTMLVFVSAGDDFEYAAPVESGNNTETTMHSFSLYRQPTAQSGFSEEVPAHTLCNDSVAPDVYKEVFGEKIASIRELLHRSSLSRSHFYGATSNTAGLSRGLIPLKHIPPPPGPYVGAWDTGSIGPDVQPIFYTKMHPIVFFGNCFIGHKGSVNVAVNSGQSNVTNGAIYYDTSQITREQYGSTLSIPNLPRMVNLEGTSTSQTRNGMIEFTSGATGVALTNTRTNAGMVANLPYYANSGFNIFDLYKLYSNGDSFTDNNNDWYKHELDKPHPTGTSSFQNAFSSIYYGTGPDFDLVFFINCPLMNEITYLA